MSAQRGVTVNKVVTDTIDVQAGCDRGLPLHRLFVYCCWYMCLQQKLGLHQWIYEHFARACCAADSTIVKVAVTTSVCLLHRSLQSSRATALQVVLGDMTAASSTDHEHPSRHCHTWVLQPGTLEVSCHIYRHVTFHHLS